MEDLILFLKPVPISNIFPPMTANINTNIHFSMLRSNTGVKLYLKNKFLSHGYP